MSESLPKCKICSHDAFGWESDDSQQWVHCSNAACRMSALDIYPEQWRTLHDQSRCAELEAEILEQNKEISGLQNTVIRQGELLTGVVEAIRGEPPHDTAWSHHDAPELARQLKAEIAALREDAKLWQLRAECAEDVIKQREPDTAAIICRVTQEAQDRHERESLTVEEALDMVEFRMMELIRRPHPPAQSEGE